MNVFGYSKENQFWDPKSILGETKICSFHGVSKSILKFIIGIDISFPSFIHCPCFSFVIVQLLLRATSSFGGCGEESDEQRHR